MRIIVAPDSFKHTLSALEVARLVCDEGRKVLPNSQFVEFPVSDGGEGFLDTIAMAYGEKMALYECTTEDPLGRGVVGKIGILDRHLTRVGIIEVAGAVGATLLGEDERDPMLSSSFGVGQLISKAMSMDVREFWIGIGGTATVDGGMGLLSSLGATFKDRDGNVLRGNGGQLCEVCTVEPSSKTRQLSELKIRAFCDIDNPLMGPEGAIVEYGPQKGANPEMIARLQEGMVNYIAVLERTMGVRLVGSHLGAGGGIAAGLSALVGAELIPGIEGVLDLTNFQDIVSVADLVITGEGKTDKQTYHGKAPIGILRRCQKVGVPVILLSGCIDLHEIEHDSNEFSALISTVVIGNSHRDEQYDLRLRIAARNVFSLIKLGMATGAQ